MSRDLTVEIGLALDQLLEIKTQLAPLAARTGEAELPVIETAAACAMLHSFYTEIEKTLRIIALDFDGTIPTSESWHRDLRPDLVVSLGELLAFRHLFRGASIRLMRWNKLQ